MLGEALAYATAKGQADGNMAREINRLNARSVQSITKPGRHADGGGLYLVVDASGAKRWVFLYRRSNDGKLAEMGLGGLHSVSLAEARRKASAARQLKAAGQDPIKDRKSQSKAVPPPTFKAFSDEVIAALEGSWRNEKHRAQWRSTLSNYCKTLHSKPVNEIDTGDILRVLQPIWREKPETASRLRGRIEKVLDAATANGHRTGENPARWRGHLDHLLGRRLKLQRGHHPAMPWQEVPDFVARLREQNNTAARCLEFVILTACRSGEVLRSIRDGTVDGLRWDEIDLEKRTWIVPAHRMKAGREHRKPLCDRSVEIIQEMSKAKRCEFVFPGQREDSPLSEMALEALMRRLKAKPFTVHGFRSSFRDWAGEATAFERELAEAALSHQVGDQVERAYRRGDALERRRVVMKSWSAHCSTTKIIAMRRTI